ncbi:MAG: DegV family protein [Eubacteriaceae bacterium]|jgi:DegV family protein with EDD domain
MNVKIITDSAADLPRKEIEEYDIRIIPLNIVRVSDEKLLKDGIDIHPDELYKSMREGVRYKTSQISYQEFYDVFREYAEKNEPFIYLGFSSGLSGTYQSSCLALADLKEKYPNLQAESIDTLAVTAGLGMIVGRIGKLAHDGASFQEIVDETMKLIPRIHHVFTVTDLNYLYEGGRLSKTSAVVGKMLNINPIMIINEEGKIEVVSKQRGQKKTIQKMIDYLKENGGDKPGAKIYITNCDNPEYAKILQDALEQELTPKEYTTFPMTAIIGTHTGPGSLTLHFFDER